MTGLDRLSYQSRWAHVAPERKFLLWMALMMLAFVLPPLGQGIVLALTAGLTCWLLRMSFWRWCRWMALPFGFLLVGVLTILFSVTRDPHTLAVSVPVGHYWLGITVSGMTAASETFWRSLAALAATFWLVLNLPFPQLIVLLKGARAASAYRTDSADLALYFYFAGRSAGDSSRADPAFWLSQPAKMLSLSGDAGRFAVYPGVDSLSADGDHAGY